MNGHIFNSKYVEYDVEHAGFDVVFFVRRSHLRAFDLVKDRDTGNSKGYGFCVYQVLSLLFLALVLLFALWHNFLGY